MAMKLDNGTGAVKQFKSQRNETDLKRSWKLIILGIIDATKYNPGESYDKFRVGATIMYEQVLGLV